MEQVRIFCRRCGKHNFAAAKPLMCPLCGNSSVVVEETKNYYDE